MLVAFTLNSRQVSVTLFPDSTYTSGTFVFAPWETRIIYRDYPELNSSTIVFHPAEHLGMTLPDYSGP